MPTPHHRHRPPCRRPAARAAHRHWTLAAALCPLLLLLAPTGAGAADTTTATVFPTSLDRTLPSTLYGVTAEDVDNLPALQTSLQRHRQRPTVRVVFQKGTGPAAYSTAIPALRQAGYVMGEILDSSAVRSVSVDQYRARTQAFVQRYGRSIDVYEIGNELNGEWLGRPDTINAKVLAAYRVVKVDNAAQNLKAAVTLNYWPSHDCYSQSWENTLTFASKMPLEVRNGIDYLFLSFYETACDPRARPTDAQFRDTFSRLSTLFPNAKLGMGEIGAQGRADGLPTDPSLAEKQQLISRYYGLNNAMRTTFGQRYVGGGFWWYYKQDAVPLDRPGSVWGDIEAAFNAMTP